MIRPDYEHHSDAELAEESRQQSTFTDDVIPDAGDLREIEIYKQFRKWRAKQSRPLVTDAYRAGWNAALDAAAEVTPEVMSRLAILALKGERE